jgi:DNA mismatch repair ATPase MutL
LYLLSKIASKLEITTRIDGQYETRKKTVYSDSFTICPVTATATGSTVQAFDVYCKYLRRRNHIDISKCVTGIKKSLKLLSILHPQIAFVLNSEIVCNATSSSKYSFFQAFNIGPVSVTTIQSSKGDTHITGFYLRASDNDPIRHLLFVNNFLMEDVKTESIVVDSIQKVSGDKGRLHFFLSVSRPATLGHDELVQLLIEAIQPIRATNTIPLNSLDDTKRVSHFQPTSHLTRLKASKTIKWSNPVFKSVKPAIPLSERTDICLEFCIPKSELEHLQVLGQVDSKFIVIKSKTRLFLMDQHAADERVKLESFLNEYETVTGHFGMFRLDSNDVLDSITRHRAQFEKIGINIGQNSSETLSVSFSRNYRDPEQKLLEKCIAWFDEQSSDVDLFTIPCPVLEHFKSKACRSAIMFNDVLTLKECEDLFDQVKKCKFPFQCAHGRISLVPIFASSK